MIFVLTICKNTTFFFLSPINHNFSEDVRIYGTGKTQLALERFLHVEKDRTNTCRYGSLDRVSFDCLVHLWK